MEELLKSRWAGRLGGGKGRGGEEGRGEQIHVMRRGGMRGGERKEHSIVNHHVTLCTVDSHAEVQCMQVTN